jgi:hypothetical protein
MQQFALSMPQHYDKINEIIIIHILKEFSMKIKKADPVFQSFTKKALHKMLK